MPLPAFLAAPAFWGPIAASLGSVGLGAIFNNNPRRRGPDLEELRRRAMAYLDPIAMEQEVARQERYVQDSPMTAALRSQLVQAGQMGANAINQRLAQTGLGRSGVGMALEGGVRAAPGIQEAALIGQLMQQARERAGQIQQLRAQTVMSGGMMPDDPNYMAQMLGAVIGAGMGPAMEASFGKNKATVAPTAEELQASAKNNILNGTAQMRAHPDVPLYLNQNSPTHPFSSARNLPGFPKPPKAPNYNNKFGQPFTAFSGRGFMGMPKFSALNFGLGSPYNFGRVF
jgi:hypothetical protein